MQFLKVKSPTSFKLFNLIVAKKLQLANVSLPTFTKLFNLIVLNQSPLQFDSKLLLNSLIL